MSRSIPHPAALPSVLNSNTTGHNQPTYRHNDLKRQKTPGLAQSYFVGIVN